MFKDTSYGWGKNFWMFMVKGPPYCSKWMSSYVLNSHTADYKVTPLDTIKYNLKAVGQFVFNNA